MESMTLRRCLAGGLLLAGAACGGTPAAPSTPPTTAAAPQATVATPQATAAGPPSAAGSTLEIGAEDYAFTGVPGTAAPGTTLAMTNASSAEVHEAVVLALGDEARPLEEILELPQEEQPGEFVGVLVAPPGEETFAPGPPVVLTEPGRYALLCFIPQGVDPAEYLAAAEQAQGGPPDVQGGPPHVALGMFAELTVE